MSLVNVNVSVETLLFLLRWGRCRDPVDDHRTIFHDVGRICVDGVYSGVIPNIYEVSKEKPNGAKYVCFF